MEKVMSRRIAEILDDHLPKFKELAKKRRELQNRLSRAEKERDTVKSHIYKKVVTEYQNELSRVEKELAPLEKKIDEVRKMISDELASIDEQQTSLEDDIEELGFRHRVGEFDESEFSRLESPVREQLADVRKRRGELEGWMSRIDDSTLGDITEAPTRPQEEKQETAAEPIEEPATSHEPAVKEPSGAEEPMPAAEVEKDDGLVRPSEWMREFEEEVLMESAAEETTAPPDEVRETERPVEEDSSKVTAEEERALPRGSGAPPPEEEKGFPILILTKGPGAGKKLPLLPMTMTLGREQDNNIELKDDEVARYHARISFENGVYVLYDLESSTGTWLNDERVETASLRHGDKIRVGSTEMIIDFD